MLNAKIRGAWDKGMRPVGGFIGRSGITPNQITIFGVLVQGVASYLIVIDRLGEAGGVLIVAALLDTVDGAVAKARGLTSRFGALLDSTMDRLSDALVFLPIAWLYLAEPTSKRADMEWVAALALTTLVLSFLVSYTKARAEGLGFECNVGLIERAERLIVMIVALVFSALLPVALALLALASLATFVQRIVHVHRQSSTV
ncbi:MAG: CDP-alcohol phosphatidyltransferase family protein [Actinomycetota bacterium]